MTTAKVSIADMIARIEDLKAIGLRTAPKIAEVVKAHLRATIARGVDPYGNPWPVRKDTGERTLQHADQTLEVHALGTHTVVEIHGIDARHHHGAVRGSVKRPVIFYKRELPPDLVVKIRAVIAADFNRTVSGDG